MTAEATVVSLFEKAAWEVARKKYDSLHVEQKISELGIDSVAMLEVIGFVEEELDIHLPDEKKGGMRRGMNKKKCYQLILQ